MFNSDKTVTEMTSDLKMSTNPSYNSTKQNRKQEDQYDYVYHSKLFHHHNTQDIAIKMDSNPSYGVVQDYDATDPDYVQPNPPKLQEITKIFEDQHGYIETSIQRADYLKLIGSTTEEEDAAYDVATDNIDNVKINPNPSYDTASNGVKLQDNPSYSKIK